MAKIAVVAANGKASRKIISEALSRGFDVTAFGRHEENNTEAKTYVRKDILDLTRKDLAGFDAVVNGFGAFTPETFPLYQTTTEHLADILAGSDTRLLFVGGAGSLYTNPERTETLADGKDFPEAIRPLAQAMKKSLGYLRTRNDVRWTYISPAAVFLADGPRTGFYELTGEDFTVNKDGKSEISYADYAIAMVDEIEHGNHIRERISVRWA